jgi:hypothetical protein
MSKSEEIAARAAKYNHVERVADSIGRVIGVHRLKPSQQLKVEEFAGNLTGTVTMTDERTGTTVEVPRRFPLMIAASVCEIDDVPFPFPKNRAELDAVLDRLDDEGMTAVVEAFGKLNAGESEKPESGQGQDQEDGAAVAKNSRRASNSATPSR